jgi:hypothetical protein
VRGGEMLVCLRSAQSENGSLPMQRMFQPEFNEVIDHQRLALFFAHFVATKIISLIKFNA